MKLKKSVLFCFVAFFTFFSAEAKKIEGQILENGETYDVLFNVTMFMYKVDYQQLEVGIKYYDENGKKILLEPGENIEVTFKYNKEQIKLASVQGYKSNRYSASSYVFMKVEEEGELTLFSTFQGYINGIPYYTDGNNFQNRRGGMLESRVLVDGRFYVLKGKDGSLFSIQAMGKHNVFKRRMTWFFRDCPVLLDGLKANKYRAKDLDKMVEIYNSTCN